MGTVLTFIPDSWSQRNNSPTPEQFDPASGSISGVVYVVYGSNEEQTTMYTMTRAHSTSTDSWSTKTDAHSPGRIYASASVLEGKLHIFGGTDLSTIFTDMYVYDPSTDSWAVSTPMVDQVYGAGGVTI